jgi:hypothetical protein
VLQLNTPAEALPKRFSRYLARVEPNRDIPARLTIDVVGPIPIVIFIPLLPYFHIDATAY